MLIAFQIKNWNKELSPWPAPAIFGKDDFGDGAPQTLSFIEHTLIEHVHQKYKLHKNTPVILGGYSLAGLFSLWSSYNSKRFDSAVAAFPSVWFNGWLDYVNKNIPMTDTIYISMGDKEEKTKNQTKSKVGQVIRELVAILKNQELKTISEWNNGGHFQDSHIRLAKGFLWSIKKFKRNFKTIF